MTIVGSGKILDLKEDVVSMFLGLFIVVLILFLLFNFFKKKSGRVDLDGLSDTSVVEEGELAVDDSESFYYMVVRGDSLWKIAEKKYGSGYAWTDLAEINGLANADVLFVGQRIELPDLKVEEDLASVSEYVVKKDDSLSKIALRVYGDMFAWERIWEANKSAIMNPNLIEIGMMLNIPR